MLCFDVAMIVVKYLDLMCLKSFFVQNGLGFDTKFKYGNVNCNMNDDVMEDFPGMVLVGVRLGGFNPLRYSSRMGKLKCCEVICDCCEVICDCCDCDKYEYNVWKKLMIVDGIADVNIKMLSVINCWENGLDEMNDLLCKNLECVVFGKEDSFDESLYLKGVSRWKKLKKIVINNGLYMCDDDFDELALCSSLVYLDVDIKTRDTHQLRCGYLRVLRIRNLCDGDLEIIRGCMNLEKLVIEQCSFLYNVSALRECVKLKSLMISGCSKLIDCSVLYELVGNLNSNLKRVKIVDREKNEVYSYSYSHSHSHSHSHSSHTSSI